MTIKAAIVAPTILERANRGPDIPRFQRPTSKAQRPRPNEEKREVENPNTARTPNTERRMVIFAESSRVASPLSCSHACDENSDQLFGFSQACDQTRIPIQSS